MRIIRFHDLRHSCASLMLANGVSMKQIQDWLGHSTFKITADTYAHLSSDSKLSAANALHGGTAFSKISSSSAFEEDKEIYKTNPLKEKKPLCRDFKSFLAEGVGVEPTDEDCPSPVFKTGAFDHSAILPNQSILEKG